MKRLLPLLVALASTFALHAEDAPINELGSEEKAAGWKLLFDGEDAHPWWRGYKKDELPAGWKVENGTLIRRAAAGDIITGSVREF